MITNTNVYGLKESIKASGYPKTLMTNKTKFSLDRARKLSDCKTGTGHDCFLKGIIVQTDITAPIYWWPQFQRYHFADIISSQSKMHCLHKFDIDFMCNEWVDRAIIEIAKKHIEAYNKHPTEVNLLRMVSNIPSGFQLTARITTNYLQLKTIYLQRKNHKLPEWKEFCRWIKLLPNFELVCK